MKKCPFCGVEAGDSVQYCLNCGAEIGIPDQLFSSISGYNTAQNSANQNISFDEARFPSGNRIADLPRVQGWNWGAFVFTWIWLIGNGSLAYGLLCLAAIGTIPFGFFIIPFILGIYGNELIWKNKQYASVEAFKDIQKKWASAACIFLIILCLCLVIPAIISLFLSPK